MSKENYFLEPKEFCPCSLRVCDILEYDVNFERDMHLCLFYTNWFTWMTSRARDCNFTLKKFLHWNYFIHQTGSGSWSKEKMGFIQPPVLFPLEKGWFVTFRVSLVRRKMPSCFIVETSSSVSKKRSFFELRLNVSRTRSSSLREIEWPQGKERNIVLRPGFSEANSASEMNSSVHSTSRTVPCRRGEYTIA